jgi:O-antigen ligase
VPIAVVRRPIDLIATPIFWLFVAGLAWAPLWHGGNEAIVWGLNAMFFPGLAILYEVSLLLCGRPHPIGLRCIRLPTALFLLLSAWIGLQGVTGLLPEGVNPVWSLASEAVGTPLPASISINRDLTVIALLRLVTGGSVFWLALQLCRDASRARYLITAIAVIGALYAAYGLLAAKTGWLRLPGMPQSRIVSATFINSNSYAAFAGIGFLAMMGVLFRLDRRYGIGKSRTMRRQLAALVEMIGRGGAPVLAGGFIILTALFLTGSRAGIAATGVAVAIYAVLAGYSGARRKSVSWLALILGFMITGIGLGFGMSLRDKVVNLGLFDPNRLAVYRLTLRSIIDRPWLGWGYGTFVDVFPIYRDGSIDKSGTWAQAHNTYLEVIQGLGILFGTIALVLAALLVARCVKGAISRRENAFVPLVAVSATVLVGGHALIDFSVQIQAVALTVAALLGAGVAQARSARLSLGHGMEYPISQVGRLRSSINATRWQWLAACIVLIPCVYATMQGYDLASCANRTPSDRNGIRLDAAVLPETTREGGQCWLGLPGFGPAASNLPLAQIAAVSPAIGKQQTIDLIALVAARPLSSQAWLSLAIYRLVAREPLASVLAALRLSWTTGPNEGSLAWQRGIFALALWDFLPADARERATRDVASALHEDLVADHQIMAVKPIIGGKSAETRMQIRTLLQRQGLPAANLARIGLPAE